MSVRAHLKLIVSEPAETELEESVHDRMSMVQPVSNLRWRLQWLRHHAAVLALWSATAVLLSVAGLLLISRL